MEPWSSRPDGWTLRQHQLLPLAFELLDLTQYFLDKLHLLQQCTLLYAQELEQVAAVLLVQPLPELLHLDEGGVDLVAQEVSVLEEGFDVDAVDELAFVRRGRR